MPELSAAAWALLGLAAVIVGLSKTAVPGSNTISIAIFAAILPARESTGALLVLLIVADAFAIWIYRRDADWAALRRLTPTVLGGLLLGAAFLAVAGDSAVRRVIGVVLLLVIGVTLARRWAGQRAARQAVRDGVPVEPADPSASATGWRRHLQTGIYGTLGGFTTMVANAAGPVMSMYFLASGFSIKRFLGTAAWFFAIVNLLKAPFSVALGLINTSILLIDLVLLPGVVLGAFAGRSLATRMNQQVFDRLVITLTIVGAGYLLV